MSVVSRHSLAAAGLVCLTALCPGALLAQRGAPNADTPRILIATFRTASADARLGVEGADALRDRVQREQRPDELWVIPKIDIDKILSASDVPRDSALSLADLKVLAQTLRADAIVDGIVTKTPTGVAVSARYVLPSNIALVQPLPTIEAPTLEQAAKELERHLTEVQRSLLDFRRCSSAIAAQKYDEAQAAARQGIARYPSSTLSRLCLLDALSREQQPTDSVIRAAQAVLRIDSTSVLALMNLVSAYEERHDTTNAIDAMLQLIVYRLDLRRDVVRKLGQMNRARLALPIIAEMLRENPDDPDLLKQQWLLFLANRQWKQALQAGDALVRSDTAAASSDYFTRSIAAAVSDSQPALAADIAAQAVAKFPKDASLWALAAQAQHKAGRTDAALASARRATALDPKTENAWPVLIVAQIELGHVDSALVSARTAIASGADKASIGRVLQLPLSTTAKHASEEKSRASWLELTRLSAAVDSIVPSADAKYFLTIGAFYVGSDVVQSIKSVKRCDEVLLAEDMWAIASINAPQAALAGPEQKQVAAQIMTTTGQYSDLIAQAKKKLCAKRR